MLLLDWILCCFHLLKHIIRERVGLLQSRRELAAWAAIADDGSEGTQLQSLPVFTRIAGDRVRKGRLHWALPSTEINTKIALIFNRGGNCLQFCIKEPTARCALPSHLPRLCSKLLDISRDFFLRAQKLNVIYFALFS